MNILELSQQRFSARKYTPEPVSQADLDYILECVRLAPSAVNKQPWKFIIVRSEIAKSKLWQVYDREWFRTAPLYIICMKNNTECWTRRYDDKPHGDIDVAIATEHLCLAATERGLGTCWVCNYDTKKMSELFPSDSFEAVAIIPIGHIAADCPRTEKKRNNITLTPLLKRYNKIKMKKTIFITVFMVLYLTMANAQEALKKVYNESIDPMEQIDKALAKAKANNKYVVCQIGGNWCPWCLRFAHFVETNSAVNKTVSENFELIHVNYNPRKSAGDDASKKAAKMMQRLGNPTRFGFPVFVVLDNNGSVLHIQDSSFLEEDNSYSEKKVLRFFKNWTPTAVGNNIKN